MDADLAHAALVFGASIEEAVKAYIVPSPTSRSSQQWTLRTGEGLDQWWLKVEGADEAAVREALKKEVSRKRRSDPGETVRLTWGQAAGILSKHPQLLVAGDQLCFKAKPDESVDAGDEYFCNPHGEVEAHTVGGAYHLFTAIDVWADPGCTWKLPCHQ